MRIGIGSGINDTNLLDVIEVHYTIQQLNSVYISLGDLCTIFEEKPCISSFNFILSDENV